MITRAYARARTLISLFFLQPSRPPDGNLCHFPGMSCFKSYIIKKGQDVTTSLIVAEVFGKRHDHVLRDIENLSCSDAFRLLNFGETLYIHPQNGQTYPMFEMTKDGFSFLVMRYSENLHTFAGPDSLSYGKKRPHLPQVRALHPSRGRM